MQTPPPLPKDAYELMRVTETRRRRRMMSGLWREDIDGKLVATLGHIRKEAWGEPDLSSNVFRSSCTAVSVLHDRTCTVDHAEESGSILIALVAESGRWSLMQRMQRQTIAFREMLCRVDARKMPDGRLEITDRPVYPDMVECEVQADDPSCPAVIREWRQRNVDGQLKWTRDVWSIYDGGSYHIDDGNGLDITAKFTDRPWSGEAYPYKKADGTSVLPFGLWHGAVTGQLFDPFELSELVEGSLNCALYWCFFGHVMRNCSWPQRWGINARPSGVSSDGTVDAIMTDPATIALFEGIEEAGSQAILGQWAAGADPQIMADAISVYERRVAAYAGITPADVQRVAGDPRSGFAIALNRESQREAQRRYEPIFRPSDEAYMEVTAIVANAALGTAAYPTEGYRITYAGLPASPEERQAERDHLEKLLSLGLTNPVEAYRTLHPELSEAEAERQLIESQLKTLAVKAKVQELATTLENTNVRREPAPIEPSNDGTL